MLKKIADLSGGNAYTAPACSSSRRSSRCRSRSGYETIRGDASVGWLRLGALVLVLSALTAVLINRRLPANQRDFGGPTPDAKVDGHERYRHHWM